MIIFNLDGTLADYEHRKHFVYPTSNTDYILQGLDEHGNLIKEKGVYSHILTGKRFQPDWKAFHEACDKDKIIYPSFKALFGMFGEGEIQIWSGRCESVRDKTTSWLIHETGYFLDEKWLKKNLKMRPVDDNTPDDQLKEKWLDERCKHIQLNIKTGETIKNCSDINFVFDSDISSIKMWKRRGIFVFNCCQYDEEF